MISALTILSRLISHELHRHGDEAAWWQKTKIDPLPIARRLWRHTRPNGRAAILVEDTRSKAEIVQDPPTGVRS
jgi:hypothetical protein